MKEPSKRRKYTFSEAEFFSIPITALVMDKRRAFPLYIYFKSNDHLILRCYPFQEISERTLENYIHKGLDTFWCPNEYTEKWQKYLNGLDDEEDEAASDLMNMPSLDENIASDSAHTEQAAESIDVILAPQITDFQKKKMLSNVGKEMMANLLGADQQSPEQKKEAFKQCQKFAQDIIIAATKSQQNKDFFEDIISLSEEMGLEHSINVSSIAVILALGIGYTEKDILADIALGALFHDIGYVDLDMEALMAAEESLTPQYLKHLHEHPLRSLKLLRRYELNLSLRAQEILLQHHERFNESGYPTKRGGSFISEFTQIVSIADMLDDYMNGHLNNGTEKSANEAVHAIQMIQPLDGENGVFNSKLYRKIYYFLESSKELSKEKFQSLLENKLSA